MINNSAGGEAAQVLGNKYRKARESNMVSINEASEQLNIRRYLLDDMEKGRFGHLKLGDCLAYAKYLSLDITVDEINRVREAQGATGATYEIDKRVYIGGAVVLGVVAAVVFAMSSGSQKTEVAGENGGVLSLPQNNDTGVIEIPVNPQAQTIQVQTVDVNAAQQAPAVQTQVQTAETPKVKSGAAAESGIVVGPESGDMIVEEEIRFESLPDVEFPDAPVVAAPKDPKKNAADFGRDVRTASAAPAENVRKQAEQSVLRTENTVKQEVNAKAAQVTAKAEEKAKSVSRSSAVQESKAKAVNAADRTVNTVQQQVTAQKKSSGLKAGQVVSLADELGYQKPAQAKQQAQKAVQKPAQKTVQADAAKARTAGNAAANTVKSGSLKSGQVVSLADEMGYQKKTQTVNKSAPAANTKAGSVVGPKITDQAEIKRRASQVVITEAVQ